MLCFVRPSESPPPIHGNASAKAALYKDRFLFISQRLSRHQHFAKRAFDSDMSDFGSCEVLIFFYSTNSPKFNSITLYIYMSYACQISQIQSLVGQTGRRWVMGLISQLEDGHFYLEDLTASVEINLSNAISFTHSFHTCLVATFFLIYAYLMKNV